MAFLFWLALVLITLTCYSAGAVLALWVQSKKREQKTDPSLLDVAMVILMWGIMTVVWIADLSKWSVPLVLLIAFGCGALLAWLQPRSKSSTSLTL